MSVTDIDDFDKKVDESAAKIDQLIERVSKATKVGDLLSDASSRQMETLQTLKDIHSDLKSLVKNVGDASQSLSEASKVVASTEPTIVLQKLSAISDDLENLDGVVRKVGESGKEDVIREQGQMEAKLSVQLSDSAKETAARIEDLGKSVDALVSKKLVPVYLLLLLIAGLSIAPLIS